VAAPGKQNKYMGMELSPRLAHIKPSSTLKIASLAKQLKAEGKKVVDFSVGEPDFDTPDPVKKAAIEALQKGFTKYTPPAGIPDLKTAIIDKLKRENNLTYTPKQIIVTSGAKQAIFSALFAILGETDEVLISAPYWVSYPEMVSLAGAKPVIMTTAEQEGFKLTPQLLQKSITKNTKALILNYPSNPAGVMYTKQELESLSEVLKKHSLYVISDEIYEKIVFDGRSFTSFGSLKDMHEKTITINGVSKSFSMTGFRIGYIAAPEKVASACETIQSQTTSCATSFCQKAAVAAFTLNDEWFAFVRKTFELRRERIYNGLSRIKKISVHKPEGAFYVFCNIGKTGMNGNQFCERLLQEECVAAVPGDGFGYADYMRLSFATSDEQIDEGIVRIERFINREHRKPRA